VRWTAPLILLASSAWAALDPPNTIQCREKFENGSCQTDQGVEGSCISQQIKVPDFTNPGPPVFKEERAKVCVPKKERLTLKEVLGAVGVGAVLFALVLFKLLARPIFGHRDP
jgi:hypothetical protein